MQFSNNLCVIHCLNHLFLWHLACFIIIHCILIISFIFCTTFWHSFTWSRSKRHPPIGFYWFPLIFNWFQAIFITYGTKKSTPRKPPYWDLWNFYLDQAHKNVIEKLTTYGIISSKSSKWTSFTCTWSLGWSFWIYMCCWLGKIVLAWYLLHWIIGIWLL